MADLTGRGMQMMAATGYDVLAQRRRRIVDAIASEALATADEELLKSEPDMSLVRRLIFDAARYSAQEAITRYDGMIQNEVAEFRQFHANRFQEAMLTPLAQGIVTEGRDGEAGSGSDSE